MNAVKAKKHLGQHFLTDLNIAKRIADTLSLTNYNKILEIGPGMGVLTQFLLQKNTETFVIEIDKESVAYLQTHFPALENHIVSADFLKYDIVSFFNKEPFAIIGNFPYNISSQIIFKLLEIREFIPEFSGMFQKEVAERICEKPGSKTYGILSVLTQAFYETEYLFSVSESVFNPPPKVKSGVLRLKRKANFSLPCDEKLFFSVVKNAFGQRRKTLRNSLKSFLLDKEELKNNPIFEKRPEQLSVEEFIEITQMISL
ncbi:MAG: 16S rRNA (adenine(1518)-N(6)/adenine(1519)-N(6))-dimethyltransferase RsmA [Capnocytophaga sp.]|nr:16S rRNA (adenine(1518)-N(6)/adenine(1519)-N(6))-dimethyltransferase RsmA [Capnocytophaga sp.]